jgi:hypothetical protein
MFGGVTIGLRIFEGALRHPRLRLAGLTLTSEEVWMGNKAEGNSPTAQRKQIQNI